MRHQRTVEEEDALEAEKIEIWKRLLSAAGEELRKELEIPIATVYDPLAVKGTLAKLIREYKLSAKLKGKGLNTVIRVAGRFGARFAVNTSKQLYVTS